MKRERTILQAEALSLAVAMYQLPHREHCGGEFRGSEQSILGFGIVEQDAVPRMNRSETDEIEELGE
jgi:hypothetical protein